MYNLIGIYRPFVEGKNHICKENGTMDSMCGKNLGFDYGIITVDGYENSKEIEYTKDEILQDKRVCKKCLSILNKTK